jgi:hypothetical protein
MAQICRRLGQRPRQTWKTRPGVAQLPRHSRARSSSIQLSAAAPLFCASCWLCGNEPTTLQADVAIISDGCGKETRAQLEQGTRQYEARKDRHRKQGCCLKGQRREWGMERNCVFRKGHNRMELGKRCDDLGSVARLTAEEGTSDWAGCLNALRACHPACCSFLAFPLSLGIYTENEVLR